MRTPARAFLRITASCGLLALLAAGCGTSGSGSSSPRPAGPAVTTSSDSVPATTAVSSAAAGTSTRNVPPTPKPTVPPEKPASALAKAALLTAADLPGGGWKPDSNPEFYYHMERSSRPECESAPMLKSGPKPAAALETGFYLDGAFGTEPVDGAVLVYGDSATAAKAAAHILTVTRSCRTWQNGGIKGGSYGFWWRQSIEKIPGHPETPLLKMQGGAVGFPDVPPTLGGTSMHRQGRVVVLIRATFPAGHDRDVVGYGEMTALAEKLARRGEG